MTEREVFEMLIEGTGPDREIDMMSILRSDIPPEHKRQDIWVRITAHLASFETCKRRFRSADAYYDFVADGEYRMEIWEQYCADIIHFAIDPEEFVKVKAQDKFFLLY